MYCGLKLAKPIITKTKNTPNLNIVITVSKALACFTPIMFNILNAHNIAEVYKKAYNPLVF